jgi:hypothetical protein
MRNLLALLAAVLLAFSVAGLCRGWYRIEGLPSKPGRSAFRVEIDRSRIAGDVVDAARGVVRMLTRDTEEKVATEAEAK